MPLNILTMSLVDRPVTQAEGLKILERDQFCCRYCGLDGKASFENALVMSVDFVVPRARKGKKDQINLVACCRPCNTIKGTKVYASFDDAKKIRPSPARRTPPRLGIPAWPRRQSRLRLTRCRIAPSQVSADMLSVSAGTLRRRPFPLGNSVFFLQWAHQVPIMNFG